MFESKNLYVLNKKDANAIVYEDADGCIIRLTRDMFATQEEFDQWKSWSDEDYHTEELGRHIMSNHTISLEGLSEEAAATATSPEDDFFSSISEEERKEMCRLLMTGLDACLTEVQRHRLWLYYVDGLSLRDISLRDGSAPINIRKSILAAKKKILIFLQKQG